MLTQGSPHHLKDRELRRRVVLSARMRAESGWSDACILNISSRGLMINAIRAAETGSTVEVWHGDHMIVAHVIWRKGTRAGLRAEDRLPIEDMTTASQTTALQTTALQPTAMDWHRVERRKGSRSREDSRRRSRMIKFARVAVIAASFAMGVYAMFKEAFAEPFALVAAALGG
jgi:hypothetical protein